MQIGRHIIITWLTQLVGSTVVGEGGCLLRAGLLTADISFLDCQYGTVGTSSIAEILERPYERISGLSYDVEPHSKPQVSYTYTPENTPDVSRSKSCVGQPWPNGNYI
jgi:hypothetical protein